MLNFRLNVKNPKGYQPQPLTKNSTDLNIIKQRLNAINSSQLYSSSIQTNMLGRLQGYTQGCKTCGIR
jgi:hypothetical protein